MNFEKARERYLNDAKFHTLVDYFYVQMFQQKVIFSELHDALMFAGLKFEMENIRPYCIVKEATDD
jgi:hypothetical protein